MEFTVGVSKFMVVLAGRFLYLAPRVLFLECTVLYEVIWSSFGGGLGVFGTVPDVSKDLKINNIPGSRETTYVLRSIQLMFVFFLIIQFEFGLTSNTLEIGRKLSISANK